MFGFDIFSQVYQKGNSSWNAQGVNMQIIVLFILLSLLAPPLSYPSEPSDPDQHVTQSESGLTGYAHSNSAVITSEGPFVSGDHFITSLQNLDNSSGTLAPVSAEFAHDYEYLINPAELLAP